MPQDKQVKKVVIFDEGSYVYGFRFFDKTNSVISEVGILSGIEIEIILEDDEVIMGFVAKEFKGWPPEYTDF